MGSLRHACTKSMQKWTGSSSLGVRFSAEVLNTPKTFTKRDFAPLTTQWSQVMTSLRDPTPTKNTALRKSKRRVPMPEQQTMEVQRGWNEYDDGSEAENEPYTIFVDADAESTFPGARAAVYVFAALSLRAKRSSEKLRSWLNPHGSLGERRPLNLSQDRGYSTEHSYVSTVGSDSDIEADTDASSAEFPAGYAAHYATFPSIRDQKAIKQREAILFRSSIGCFLAAFLLLLVAGLLVATGRHRLRVEVDAGTIIGVVASLFFATLGLGSMLYRQERLSWMHRIMVSFTFLVICVISGILLVLVAGNTMF